jgi:hypothetical protein
MSDLRTSMHQRNSAGQAQILGLSCDTFVNEKADGNSLAPNLETRLCYLS